MATRTRLELERLESRCLLAVRVFVSDGDLFVVGDAANDLIFIEQVGFQRYDVIGNGGTDIIGDADDVVTVRVRDDFRISLGAGNDKIKLDGPNSVNGRLTVPDELIINMGSGNDRVRLFDVRVPDNVTINTGTGADDVDIFDTRFGDDSDFYLNTGDDGDRVEILRTFFGDEVEIYLGRGTDTMTVCDCVFTDETLFSGGRDNDELFHLNAYLDDFERFGFEVVAICD
jgi:hypothetical protein